MFRVRWAKNVERENRNFTTMTIPDAKSATVNAIAKHEPWVHAKHVTQCFFITDPRNPIRVVVRRGKRNIIRNGWSRQRGRLRSVRQSNEGR